MKILAGLVLFAVTLSAQELKIEVIVAPDSGYSTVSTIIYDADELKQNMLAKYPKAARVSILDREKTAAFAPPAPTKGRNGR